MSTVLQLPVSRDHATSQTSGRRAGNGARNRNKMAEIIIFPGVRIERHGDIDLSDRLTSGPHHSEEA